MNKKNIKQNGQVALIVLVISAIVMTVGLSVSQKSVVETKITTDEELLKQAFNAAESGLEYYLGTGVTAYTSVDTTSRATVDVADVGGGNNFVNLGNVTLRNLTNYTWLVGHNSTTGDIDYSQYFGGNSLNVCVNPSFSGALKVDYFYQDSLGNFNVKRLGYNVSTTGRVNNYSDVPSSPVNNCPGIGGLRGINLPLTFNAGDKPLLLAVKPIGADTSIAVSGNGGIFPIQGKEVNSTGITGNTAAGDNAAQVQRKIKIFNQYQVPSFMLDAITATGDVLSN